MSSEYEMFYHMCDSDTAHKIMNEQKLLPGRPNEDLPGGKNGMGLWLVGQRTFDEGRQMIKETALSEKNQTKHDNKMEAAIAIKVPIDSDRKIRKIPADKDGFAYIADGIGEERHQAHKERIKGHYNV